MDQIPDSLAGRRVLILDADGVLRRLPDGERLDGIPVLEEFLERAEFSDVLVVAAGEWKRYLRLAQIRALFSPAIRPRIVGATPEVEGSDRFRSHVEIHAWLDAHPEVAEAVVLESGQLWQQLPALECAVFVQPGGVLGEPDLRGLARILGPAAHDQEPRH